MTHSRFSSFVSALALCATTAIVISPLQAMAQQAAGFSQLDVRRPDAAADLNAHLARLGTNPRDITALIGAGEAALALEDPRAATGFFARADEISSGNGRIKSGLARAMLQMQNPGEAIRLFDQAARLGYQGADMLSDRGLARDLSGDQDGAQADYLQALKLKPDDAVLQKRYGVSLGISGKVDAAEKAIEPLLYKNDREAWRDRAFIFAMNGRRSEALQITSKTMPKPLADAIQPYMERMSILTPAQKAAAVHFGRFPTNIRTAAVPAPAPVAPPVAVAAAAPVAESKAKGRRGNDRRQRSAAPVAGAGAAPTQLAAAQPRLPEPPAPPAEAGPVERNARSPDFSSQAMTNTAGNQPPAGTRSVPTPTPTPAGPPFGASQNAAMAAPQSSTSSTPSRQPIPMGRSAYGRLQGPASVAGQGTFPASAQQAAPPSSSATGAPSSPAHAVPVPSAPVSSGAAPSTMAQVQGPPSPDRAVSPPASQPAQVAAASPAPATGPVATASTPAPNPQATRSLADIIRELDVPEAERRQAVAAVDLNEVARLQAEKRRAQQQAAAEKAKKDAAAKAKAEAAAKAKAEAEEKARLARSPARSWVQIGTGRDISALAFTLRGLRKDYAAIAKQDAYTAPWGRTNRLVIGPFASFTRARAVEAELKKAGTDAFAWQSEAGEEVKPIGGK
ncbi:tetratricopeptide repeat protein [Sphingobium sp. H39-3-25]|uniref:tetratricopeptide repeat protein n=1 Tax=Sphingobium arseniciresistens TaxID=3030834 RepID=UPI0023B90B97|nr:tetratricopeptide repeat protein [Sphingobium arseniciresistens]